MPTWPLSLPTKPLEDGYEETLRASQVRSNIDGIDLVQRQRSPAYVEPVKLTFQFTNAELDTFQDFFRDDLGLGAIPFDFVHSRTNVAIRFRFVGGQVPKSKPIGYDTYHTGCLAEVMP